MAVAAAWYVAPCLAYTRSVVISAPSFNVSAPPLRVCRLFCTWIVCWQACTGHFTGLCWVSWFF